MVINLPSYDPDPNRTRRRSARVLNAEGRDARRLGLAITYCPRFPNADMVIDWKSGWRWEDERLRRL
jgi:hypothetical protein